MTEEAAVAAEARVADGRRALAELATLERELELRDLVGALVPTDAIHVTEALPAPMRSRCSSSCASHTPQSPHASRQHLRQAAPLRRQVGADALL